MNQALHVTYLLSLFLTSHYLFFFSEELRANEDKNNLTWLAFGDLRGNIEPCGCDPNSDFGGVRRLSQVIQLEKSKNSLLINLGNIFSNKTEDSINSEYILKAIASTSPDVSLLNRTEIYNLKNLNSTFNKDAKKLNFILSNFSSKVKRPLVLKEVWSNDDAIFLGYTHYSDTNLWTMPIDQKILTHWRSLIGKSSNRKTFLLFSGSEQDLKKILNTITFDYVLRSNPTPIDAILTQAEMKDDSILFNYVNSQLVDTVPVGGQGIIRPALKNSSSTAIPDLSKLIFKRDLTETTAGPKNPRLSFGFDKNARTIWLSKIFEHGAPLKNLIDEYYERKRSAFRAKNSLKPSSAEMGFVGSSKCIACHSKAYETWSKSSHAHALDTLKQQNKHEVDDCIQCHVVSYKNLSPYQNEQATPHLGNVQCENCHGPRREHIKNPLVQVAKKKVSPNTDICLSCHNTAHSPLFDAKKYWEKITH
ncbi:MAG: cytochrome c family protein [Oligoflexales bacterium]|nr:cytochrome c family protein [Oligoflexales bacterium]